MQDLTNNKLHIRKDTISNETCHIYNTGSLEKIVAISKSNISETVLYN